MIMNALIFDGYEPLKYYCGGGANTSTGSNTHIDFPPPPRAFLFSSSVVFERSPRIIRNMGCGHSEPTTIEPIDKLDNDYEVRPAT